MHDVAGLIDGAIEIIVDQKVLVGAGFAGLCHFALGFTESTLNGCLILASPRAQANEQLILARRGHENKQRFGHGLSNLDGAIDVDFEHNIAAGGQMLLDGLPRRSVMVIEDRSPFEQLAAVDRLAELLLINKVVVNAFGIGDGLRPRGHGDAEHGAQTLDEAMHDAGYEISRDSEYVIKIPFAEMQGSIGNSPNVVLKPLRDLVLDFFKSIKQEKCSIFGLNDDAARGVYMASKEIGLTIGSDVFVAGFGDRPYCNKLSVPLTSVSQFDEQVGYEAARLLHEMITNIQVSPAQLVLPAKLCIRQSSSGEA